MSLHAFLFWFPRVLALVFAGFLGIFALDSGEPGISLWHLVGHVLVHLVPAFAVLLALALAWRRPLIGGLVFLVLGLMFTIHFATWKSDSLFWLFSMPLFIAGVAFLFSNYYKT
ncbi:MAG TPA: hypothetical protein PK971_06200 [Saprospiraceae bacterium]|nr:hypothetical protein [Saprospiraceae bacterium]HND87895.1 hypothetical protein [Saprospiraceae bacterium]HNG90656.1 hypothetical protein [Saprospiraceae bacterium]